MILIPPWTWRRLPGRLYPANDGNKVLEKRASSVSTTTGTSQGETPASSTYAVILSFPSSHSTVSPSPITSKPAAKLTGLLRTVTQIPALTSTSTVVKSPSAPSPMTSSSAISLPPFTPATATTTLAPITYPTITFPTITYSTVTYPTVTYPTITSSTSSALPAFTETLTASYTAKTETSGTYLVLFVSFSLSTTEGVAAMSSANSRPASPLGPEVTATAVILTPTGPSTTTQTKKTSSPVPLTRAPSQIFQSTPTASSNTTSGFQTSTTTLSPYCNADNELRALYRFSTDAVAFCPTFLQTPTGTFPSFLQGLSTPNVESACACFLNTTRKYLVASIRRDVVCWE